MRWSFKIGTIAGIRVELHVTFLIFLGWIALSSGLTTGRPSEALAAVAGILLIFACVVLHELGHAFAARRYGISTRDIILLPIGGVARLARMPDKPSEELVVALAGPAVNVAILGILLLLGVRYEDVGSVRDIGTLPMLLLVNTVMVLFNMVPAFPMDGGRVLRALLAMRLPYARATRIASGIGQGFALLIGVLGLFLLHNPMLAFVALFVFMAAAEERALVDTRSSLGGLPVRAAMITEFRTLDAREPLQRAVDYLMAGSQQDFPVIDGGRPVGVLTRADLVRGLQTHGAAAAVGDVVERTGDAIDAGEPLEVAMQRMRSGGRAAMPVLHRGLMIGMITLENVSELLLVRDALRRHERA